MTQQVTTEPTGNSPVPIGWSWVSFDKTCHPVSDGGRKIPQNAYKQGGLYPVVDQGEQLIGGFTDDPSMLFQGRTPVIAFGDHTRRFKLIDWPFAIGADGIKLIAPTAAWNAKCLWYFLRALRFEDRGYSRHFQFLQKSKLPLPPLPEQARIADALDELFSDLDAAESALERVREKLKLYRASVLKAAVDGTLTAEWRKQHPHTEPASELLKRILIERRRHWEEGKLAKFKAKDQEPPKNWRSKYKEPVAPDTSTLPPLPKCWCWTALGESFEVYVGATPSRAAKDYWNGEIPWLTSGEVQFCRIRDTKEKITSEGLANSSTCLNPAGSVILNMIGEGKTRGKAGILDIAACNNQNCAAIWVSTTPISSRFVYFWLLFRYEETRELGSGNNQPAMNKGIVEGITFPLPPFAEQEVIVEAIEDQLSIVDHLEADLDAKLKSAQGLRQSILRHAFTGQLVSQDPNDEPASELLKRIAAERQARAIEVRTSQVTKKNPKRARVPRPGRLKPRRKKC
jgi:type I restriction enzyme S subunit